MSQFPTVNCNVGRILTIVAWNLLYLVGHVFIVLLLALSHAPVQVIWGCTSWLHKAMWTGAPCSFSLFCFSVQTQTPEVQYYGIQKFHLTGFNRTVHKQYKSQLVLYNLLVETDSRLNECVHYTYSTCHSTCLFKETVKHVKYSKPKGHCYHSHGSYSKAWFIVLPFVSHSYTTLLYCAILFCRAMHNFYFIATFLLFICWLTVLMLSVDQ